MTYHYTAYGLCFASEIKLPEFCLATPVQSKSPEINIVEGTIEAKFDGPVVSGPFFQASQTDCLLTTPDGTQYWLQQGQKVTIARHRSNSDEIVQHFLIYGALPVLLIQRGFFLLHGSAVSDGKLTLIFLGASRSGKSTLATAFLQRGWSLVSDELVVCALDPTHKICVLPGIHQVLLWRNTFDQLHLDISLAKSTRLPNRFTISTSKQFADSLIPIRAIFCLERASRDMHQTDNQGRTKFSQIMQNIYFPQFPRPQVTVNQAQIPMVLAASTPVKTITWTSSQCKVSDLLDTILELST